MSRMLFLWEICSEKNEGFGFNNFLIIEWIVFIESFFESGRKKYILKVFEVCNKIIIREHCIYLDISKKFNSVVNKNIPLRKKYKL